MWRPAAHLLCIIWPLSEDELEQQAVVLMGLHKRHCKVWLKCLTTSRTAQVLQDFADRQVSRGRVFTRTNS